MLFFVPNFSLKYQPCWMSVWKSELSYWCHCWWDVILLVEKYVPCYCRQLRGQRYIYKQLFFSKILPYTHTLSFILRLLWCTSYAWFRWPDCMCNSYTSLYCCIIDGFRTLEGCSNAQLLPLRKKANLFFFYEDHKNVKIFGEFVFRQVANRETVVWYEKI